MANLPSAGQRPAAVAEFLDKPRAEGAANAGRLIFALDATASRELSWDVACGLTHQMFDATAGIGGLLTQLVFYRGYNECTASRWVTNAAELHRLMRQVRCAAGTTQIARVIEHAIREASSHTINAVIFIGDAMEEPLDGLAHLAAMGVPIFLFHEGHDPIAANAFRQLTSLSHGVYLPFYLNSIDRLRELLGAVAVYAAGGIAALEKHAAGRPEVLRIASQLKR